MTDAPTIPKNTVRPDICNYDLLRATGLQYLQKLSSKLWTDYNLHDPGVTLLELLCYALTDCGYRANFAIEDIIARSDNSGKNDFYTARQILICNPVTILDFKKFIIDQDGVQNAWLYKLKYDDTTTDPMVNQPAFYYQCETNKHSCNIKLKKADGYQPKYLNGLYNIMLELEEDIELGDLNANVIEWLADKYSLKVVFPVFEITFPAWDSPYRHLLEYNTVTNATATVNGTGGTRELTKLELQFDNDAAKKLVFEKLAIHVTDTASTGTLPDNATIANELVNAARGVPFDVFVFKKYKKILSVVRGVCCALQGVRDFCEDYVKFSLVRQQEILLCTDVEVTPDANLEEILAEIFYRVDEFLSPEVKFYNLGEMYDKGCTTEDIFDGPPLNHGFIVNDELSQCELKKDVHTSDLYNIIMAIPGVVSIKYLQITNYLDGVAQTEGEFWCLKLDGLYSLNLSKDSINKIHFYKKGILFFADDSEARLLIDALMAKNGKPKLKGAVNDLDVPLGAYRSIQDYYSIQNDLPEVYRTGKNGVTKNDTALRIAQAKQLKAFLLFFDQVLTNYFGQLALVKDLLSINTPVASIATYAARPVYDVPPDTNWPNYYHVQNLLQPFTGALPAATNLDDEKGYEATWSSFIADDNNNFLTNLRYITEDEDLKFKRRNQFLDHLIARFAENFSDYMAITHEMFGNKTNDDVIKDKVAFIKDYPKISSERGKAFQYGCCTKQQTTKGWPGDNISGFQRRTSRLLGFNDVTDRTLVPVGSVTSPIAKGFNLVKSGIAFRYELKNGAEVLLQSTGTYTTPQQCQATIWYAIVRGSDKSSYKIDAADSYKISLLDKSKNPVAKYDTASANQQDAEEVVVKITALIKAVYFTEGFHVVEHILLRPVQNAYISQGDLDDGFFPLCKLDEDCDCPVSDHYSFRASVIFPYWSDRFINMDFRNYAEQLLQYEAPAHVLLKICWVSVQDMYEFEQCYLRFLKFKCQPLPPKNNVNNAITRLIKKINTLTNIYPEGVLHDCDFPSPDPPIILGQSALGTFEEAGGA